MGIPVTHAEFTKRVENIPLVHRDALWAEIDELGSWFAMMGAMEDAQRLWHFAGSGSIPHAEHRRGFAEALTSALAGSVDVPSWVRETDLRTRKALTERAKVGSDWDEPPLSDTPKGRLIRALSLARPTGDDALNPAELDGLRLLREVLATPAKGDGITQVLRDDRQKAALLAIDILARHGLRDDAAALLRSWYDGWARTWKNRRFGDEVNQAFGLVSVTRLLVEGALSDRKKLSSAQCAELVARVIALASVEPDTPFPQPQDPENSLVIRTDFSDEAAWVSVCEAIRAGTETDPYAAVEFVSRAEFAGMTQKELTRRAKQGLHDLVLFVVDRKTITHPRRPVLVIDLTGQPGRTFRATPAAICGIQMNLSVQNCGFEDFLDARDNQGIVTAVDGDPT